MAQANARGDIPQAEARRALVAVAAGLGREPASSFVELRWRAGPGAPMRQAFHAVRETRGAADQAHDLAESGHDVYLGCAPRVRRSGGRDAVERVWALWCDLDGRDALERLAAFDPWPSVVVRSGSPASAHVWWALAAPLSPTDATRGLRRLAHHLGGDMAAAEPARILRLPGTLNRKSDPSRPVECTRLVLETFDAEALVGNLADPPGRRAPREPRAPRVDGGDALLTVAASEYVSRLTGATVGRDGKCLCPLPGHDERTPSFHAYNEPEQGWHCFGCRRGGTIIDFGAALYAIEPRGQGFHDVRRRLLADLLGEMAA